MANKNTISTRITLEGADEIKSALEALGRAGQQTFGKIKDAADKAAPGLGSKLDGSISRIKEGFETLRATGQKLSPAFGRVKANLAETGVAFAATATKVGLLTTAIAAAAGGLARFAQSGVSAVDLAARQADSVGATIKEFTRLAGAAKQTDVSSEDLVAALNRINVALGNTQAEAGDAGESTGKMGEALAKLGLSVGQLQSLGTEDRFRALADGFARIASAPERAAIATQLFGRGLATTLLPLLVQGGDALKAAADQAEAFGATFDEADRKIADFADGALDRLGLALEGLRNQAALAFAPLLTEGANGISQLVKDNLPLVREFATYLGREAVQLVRDFFNALKGEDAAVVNKSLLDLRDAGKAVGEGIRFAVEGVIIPAFKALEGAADGVAGILNTVFGTQFTGKTLIATAAVLKFTGVFRLLRASISTLLSAGRLLGVFFLNLRTGIAGLGLIISGLATTLLRLSIATAALIIANPAVAALVAAVILLGGGLILLSSRQTDAEKAATAHAEAMQRLKDINDQVNAGLPEATQNLEDFKNAQLAAGEATIKNAEAQLALAQQNLDNLVFETGQIGEEWLQNSAAIKQAAEAVRTQSNYLQTVKRNLAEQMIGYDNAKARADELAISQKAITDEANKAVGAVNQVAEGYKRIMVRGPNGFEKAFDVPTEKLLEAQAQLKALQQDLTTPTEGSTILDDARVKAEQFILSIRALSEQVQAALIDLSAQASDQVAALVSALPAFFDGLPATIAGVFSSMASAIQQAWDSAMSAIIGQTREMVNTVEGLIRSLQATLTRLAAAISRAKSEASGSSDGGGSGFARGGPVWGAGTSTSDSIPAWLSNGEYVIRAAAARRFRPLLDAINGLRVSPGLFNFANGGLVGLPSMRMAALPAMAGGPSSSLTLVLDNQQFSGLTGPADTIQRLERAIKSRRIRSTGRTSPYDR